MITFDPIFFDGTTPIILTSGSIELKNHIRIFSSRASATDVTIVGSSNGGNSIFKVIDGAGADNELFKVTIENITFTTGKAPAGGAIQNAAALILKGVQFAGNEATGTGGGAIYNTGANANLKISDCVFMANKFTGTENSANGGGAIYNDGGAELIILDGPGSGTSFDSNETINYGGAIYNAAVSTIDISDTEFKSNQATSPSGATGGAIYNTSTNVANTIKDSRFTDNVAAGNSALGYGGGAIANKEGVLAVSHALFEGNKGGYGGAIWNRGSSTPSTAANTILAISDGSEFLNNSAIDEGGAIMNFGATLTVSDSKFDGNKTTNTVSLGGAISIDNVASSNDSYTTLTNVDFVSNSSITGGAIRLKGQNSELTITGGKFEKNEATGSSSSNGGAIYNQNSNKKITISGTTFKANTASGNGGAIEITQSTSGELEITNSLFDGNKATSQSGSGGAINNTAVLTLTNTGFTNNEAGDVAGSNTGQGGAIASSTNLVTIDGGLFANNKAHSSGNSGAGGAIHSQASLDIQNTVFTGNQTTGVSTSLFGGGAIFTTGSTADKIFISNSIFKGNASTSSGGAVHARGTITIANSTLTGNTSGDGKDVYCSNYATGYFLNSRADEVKGASANRIKAAYSTYTGAADEIVAGTNNSADAGTLIARNAAGAVFFADLTAGVWTQADSPGTTSPFDIATNPPALSGATVYNTYIDGTKLRLDAGTTVIGLNGALAEDASGNAAPVPGGDGIITSTFNASNSSIDYSWEPAYDDKTAAASLLYNVYLSATSPVDVTGTPVASLNTEVYSNTDLSLPYMAVVVVDDDATSPLSAAYKEAADVIAPIVTTVTPASSTTGVAIDGTIEITFSEAIEITSGNVYLNELLLTDTPADLGSNKYSFGYSGLAYGTNYNIRIEGFKDVAGISAISGRNNRLRRLGCFGRRGRRWGFLLYGDPGYHTGN
ncbi:hypothetical protein AGMMS49574_13590 [Bacteroidia bacterium]|nr:hypothetical protein AGMMS49574_13590 [Bacteroidia bacterium]